MTNCSKMELPLHEGTRASFEPLKLGRRAVKTDTRTLRMSRYLTPELPPPPAACDWTRSISDWGMMLNDRLGDCTIAGCAHAVQVWSANTGGEATISDGAVLDAYVRWNGYNPADPATDRGGMELDVLTDWRQQGLDGHALLGFADPKPSDLTEIQQSIALFGGVYIGLNLPLTARNQKVWDVVRHGGQNTQPGSWGGHCVYVPKYDEHTFTCITWGGLKVMTMAFWKKYCDEAHTLLGRDWLTAQGSPVGFNLDQLQADLGAIQ
jgi:hypothetical protein